MSRKTLADPKMILVVLILQFIPFILFPPESFTLASQEWWLPVLLGLMTLVSVIQILRRSVESWPWYLLSFAQGFNIISRLMMLMPHSTHIVEGQSVLNGPYVLLTLVSIALSWLILAYIELPEIRQSLLRSA